MQEITSIYGLSNHTNIEVFSFYDKYIILYDDHRSILNVLFETKVNVYELLDAEVFLYFDIDGNAVTARVEPDTPARVGYTIKVCFDVNKINVFHKESKETICN